ncbi:MAG: MBL fold metallo-hydrolase [Sphingomonadales bacterium]|nr:MBL fold metallo-hydrolase [Sphingomonadales bacterium]MBD3774086.1 MBL fold metallo-hydrolase [Paracoccaceae bacterium]
MARRQTTRPIAYMSPAVLALALLGNAPPPEGTATEATAAHNRAVAASLPLADPRDFEDASRGLLAQIDHDILNPDGSVAWQLHARDFLDGAPPATANPSLWRQSQLTAIHGLFEVVPGIYQLRGYDLSVMTLVRGKTGWIVIDPLLSPATSQAGLALANKVLGERPVVAVIYTHSHADHFGGVLGVTSRAALEAGKVQIFAPHGFMRETVGENVLAGTAMSRRAQYQFGATLPPATRSAIGVGLGPALSVGPIGLLPPTHEVSAAGETIAIDGITFEFMDAAETEAPAEMVFYLPQFRALHTAEVATRNMHNVLTPRGALVRDALRWSRVIDTMMMRYADRSDVMLASHHWPSWGSNNVRARLRDQRDAYRFLHDQTLRLANKGLTMDEIAEDIGEPDFAAQDFGTRGYYGTYKHNAKAVYQRYFGWWDGVPADYDALPKVEQAKHWVDAVGGPDAALAKGRAAFDSGDYRWAATLLQQLVFADPDNAEARRWLAATYEQLGFQAEGGTWRNIYLTGAAELRDGRQGEAPDTASPALLASIPTADLFDALATRFDPAKMQGKEAVILFELPDTGEAVTLDLRRSVVFPRMGKVDQPDTRLVIDRADLNRLLGGEVTLPALLQAGKARLEGDPANLAHLFGAMDQRISGFAIVTP